MRQLVTLDCHFLHFGGAGNVLGRTRTFLVMSLQSWWFPETDWDDKNTQVTQVERCYAGSNMSWGGWYRAWNATSEPLKETEILFFLPCRARYDSSDGLSTSYYFAYC